MLERRTDDSGCGLLPTPSSQMAGENEDYLSSLVTKDGRPMTLQERAYDPKAGKHVKRTLNRVVKMGMLPTPTAADSVGSRNRTSSRPPDSKHHDGITLTDAVWMGMLPTPRSTDGEKGGPNQRGSKGDMALPMAVLHIDQTGSAGPMRLNPSFVEAMMGYPPGWTEID
jgi:hypothetical protein